MASAEADPPAGPEYAFEFTGGRLCLDFVNTVSGTRAEPKERLTTYADLVAWGRQAGVLGEREAQRLGQLAKRRPGEAGRILADAVQLREAMFRIFCGAAECRAQRPGDMNILNAMLSRALGQVRLDATAEGCVRVWAGGAEAMDRMLWPVLRSAMDLLTSDDERERIHKCESPTCDWLFLDTSRNHSRRWCDMKTCGNRAKAHRYYARHKHGD
ncbi:MAG TPA: ABATE domain-containing protein [bacterium]|nr:ABATE domain-containing protein [bacterium]